MLSLSLIDPNLLNRKIPAWTDAYAQELIESGAYETEEEAIKTAQEEIQAYFDEEGNLSPNQIIYSIFIPSSEEPIGCVWVAKKSAQDPNKAFLCYIEIEPEHRRKGYAKRALVMAEKKLFKMGINKIGLNVFAPNEGAIKMYLSLGYTVTYEVSLKSTGKITRYLLDKDLKAYFSQKGI